MIEIKLTYENGTTEAGFFFDYDDAIKFIAAHPDAGFRAWEEGREMNEALMAIDAGFYL